MAYPFYTQPGMYQSYPQYAPQVQPAYQSGITWVDGYAEVDGYPMAPNTAKDFWDRHQPCIYVKQTDPMGRASIKTLEYKERGQEETQRGTAATKDDLAEVLAALRRIEDELRGGAGNE